MKKIVVVGSINADITTYLSHLPNVGETVRARETLISLGGKGLNQCIAASQFGCSATMIGAVGIDVFGQDIVSKIEKYSLDFELNYIEDAVTGLALIDVMPDGANIIRFAEGANALLSPNHINQHQALISSADVLLLQNEIPFETSLAAASIARAAGTTIIMDPAPAPNPFWQANELAAFDIITPNAKETKLILGSEPRNLNEALDAAIKLKEYGVNGAIVTMGADGVAWSIGDTAGIASAPALNSVDTVAAGDCFNGVFAAILSEGDTVEAAIHMAVKAAAISTTRKGAATSVPTRLEVQSFYFENQSTSTNKVESL